MNCQQFTSFIVEAARGQMMDASSRDGAMRHVESCQACAARLAQEKSLTGALRAVALDMKDLSAPARVEAKLLNAFWENLAQQNARATTTNATPPLYAPVSLTAANTKPVSRQHARRFAFTATAIAASLVLVLLAALYLRFTRATTPTPRDVATNSGQIVSKATTPDKELTAITSPPLASSIEPSTAPGQRLEREKPDAHQGGAPQRTATLNLARRHRTPTMIKAQHVIDGGQAIFEASEGEATASNTLAKSNEAESVTEFISLVADAPAATPLESGQLVRVQVPRAALASLGLPLNAERGNEPVKADVLLGGDGLARAIRFVH